MSFIEIDPELARKAIEGYQNELEPARKGLDAFYRQFRCLRCGRSCQKEMASGHVFADPDTLIPRSLLRCTSCDCLFDPHTGLILKLGNPGAVPPDIPILDPTSRSDG